MQNKRGEWEKNAQIELDLSHLVIWLPPVSKCICFSRFFAEGCSSMRFGGTNVVSNS